mgnify:CR=1 FL=1
MNLFELYNVLKDGQKGRNNFLVTVIQGNGTGSRYFLADGEVKAQCGSGDIETERLRELVQPGESGIAEADGRRLFVESLKQPAHLVICGAGHVAQQVILLAGKVGFTVTVLEDRVSFAGEALRAGADQVICDSFENALKQIPGMAIQRLMEKGYGFGAEGDWKTAAMVRLMKIMTAGMKDAKGTSMMEDYTYNLVPGKEGILQSHMLEVCPSVADGKPAIKVCPLSMGEREDPARLVFTSKTGPAIATSLVDLGDRFRLIINDVDCKKVEKPMPKLPVATNFWTPQPDLYTGAEAWILAGGAHHTAFTYDLTAEQMGDWANAMGIEAVYIDKDTKIRDFKRDLQIGELFYR